MITHQVFSVCLKIHISDKKYLMTIYYEFLKYILWCGQIDDHPQECLTKFVINYIWFFNKKNHIIFCYMLEHVVENQRFRFFNLAN
jgi:hypothetical protein